MRSASARRIATFAALVTVGGLIASMPTSALAVPATVTQTFGYTGATATFTVPAGITQLTIGLAGRRRWSGRHGRSRALARGRLPGRRYRHDLGDAGPGPNHRSRPGWCERCRRARQQRTRRTTPSVQLLGGESAAWLPGGNGGVAGFQGSSGYGAAGGGATVVSLGGSTIVAGGAGGAGGSGQFAPTLGRVPYSSFTARADIVSRAGQNGITVAKVCNATTGSCDGGGGGAGGGGVIGGAQGDVQFGSGTSERVVWLRRLPRPKLDRRDRRTQRELPVLPRRLRQRQRRYLLHHRCPRRPDRGQRRRRRWLGRAELDSPSRSRRVCGQRLRRAVRTRLESDELDDVRRRRFDRQLDNSHRPYRRHGIRVPGSRQ